MSEVTSVNGKAGEVVLAATDVAAIPEAEVGQPDGVATLNSSGKLPEAQLPNSVVTSSANATLKDDLLGANGTTSNASVYIHRREVTGNINVEWPEFGAHPSEAAAVNTAALQAAATEAAAQEKGLLLPAIGIYKVTAAAVLFAFGAQCVPIRGAATGREGGLETSKGGTKIHRESGTSHLLTVTGTGEGTGARGTVALYDIAFDGGNLNGDLVVLSRVNDVVCQNVRFDNAQARLLRVLQGFNNRWALPYFSNGGTERRTFTGCSWESGKSKVTVKGTVPPDVENLLVYGTGIPFGTVVKEAKEIKLEEWEVILSANTTAASTATGVFVIEGSPAVSFEGITGGGSFGASAVNHLVSAEFEGNRGVDLDLVGSADGQAAPCQQTYWEGGKCERQIATNHEPCVRTRDAYGVVIKPSSINLGGSATTATGTIAVGELGKLKLTAKNGLVAPGQQVTGYGSPEYLCLKANGLTTSSVLKIQGTIPREGAGATSNEGTTFSGVTTGMRVRVPGSNAITPGTTVKAILSESELELSAAPTEEIAGGEIVIGGMFVESIAGEETVTLDTNALGAHAAQTYAFGGSRSRLIEIPSYGYSGCDLIAEGRLQHTGAPDIYVNQETGIVVESAIILTSSGPYPPGYAYHRIAKNVAVDAFKLPSRAAHAQFPLQLISDERTSATVPAGYEARSIPILGFTVNAVVTQPIVEGHALVYEAPKTGEHPSIVYGSFLVPPDIASGAWLYIDLRWFAAGTSTEKVYWQLSAHAGSEVNLASNAYVVQKAEAQKAAASAGTAELRTFATTTTIDSTKLVPGTPVYLQFARLAENPEDKLAAPVYIIDMSMHYQRA